MNDVWKEIEQETREESTPTPTQSKEIPGKPQTENSSNSFIPEWVTYPTGKKPLNHYVDHSLNFNNSKWFGRILKGVEGLTQGKLENYWFFDVGIGAYKGFFSKNSKEESS